MIIETLLNTIFSIFEKVFSVINIPGMPDGMSEQVVNFFSDTLNYAGSLISLFVPWSQVKVFFPILIVILSSEEIYKLVMWVLKKIPMLGIS
jgi:hypothetical protein